MKTKLMCFCVIAVLLFSACGGQRPIEEKPEENKLLGKDIQENTEEGGFLLWDPGQTEERQTIYKDDRKADSFFESIRIAGGRRIYSVMVDFTEIFYDIRESSSGEEKELFSIDRVEYDVLDYTINAEGNAYFLVLETKEDSEEIRVWKYDLEGIKTDIRQLNDFHKGEEDECYDWQIRAQSDGTILVYSDLGYILFDEKGSIVGEEAFEQPTFYGVWCLVDNRAVIKKYDREFNSSFWKRDLKTGEEEEMQNMPIGTYLTFLEDGDGNILFCTDRGLYCYPSGKREAQALFGWSDYGIWGEEIEGIYLAGQELHCVLRQEDILSDVTYRETADKGKRKEIILGCVGNPYWIEGGVIEFNRSHPDCVIIIEDYWQEDEEAAVQALYRKVLTGKGPDIIALDSMHVEDMTFGRSGMVEDLNAYLEKSSVICKEDIIEPLYDALEVDNKLYVLPTNFGIDALITKEKWLDEDGRWDSKRMLALLEEYADLEIYESRNEMLEAYALYGIAGQKGYETDRENIKNYLQIARMLPEWYYFPTDELVKREGGALFQNIGISSVEDYMCQTSFWGEDSAIVGYPEIKGNGMAFSLVNCFAISTKSEQKDQAWKFIESFFEERGEESNASPDGMYFSVCKDGLEKQFTRAMKREYYVNEEGEKEEIPIQTYYLGEELEEIYAAREEDIARIKDMIQGIRVIRRQNNPLVNILLEEASVCYSGDKSLEEVTDIIENRLKLLRDEEH